MGSNARETRTWLSGGVLAGALFSGCVLGCSAPAAPVIQPASAPDCVAAAPSQSPHAADAPPSVRVVAPAQPTSSDPAPSIVAFDCFKVLEAREPGCEVASASEPTTDGGSLRHWHGGGPSGAAWNPFSVECVATVRSMCTSGFATLRVAQHVHQSLPLIQAAPEQRCYFKLGPDDLDDHADERSPPAVEPVYSTVVVRLEVAEVCGDPPYLEAVHDSFVAGVAFGE